MKQTIKQKVLIIGAGIAGLAAGIRLAKAGFAVEIFEKNSYAGGKLSELQLGHYRFDKGPSLFTMPELLDELSVLAGLPPLGRTRLEKITHYFYEDGSFFCADADPHLFAQELAQAFNEDPAVIIKHLRSAARYYRITSPVFLERGLGRLSDLARLSTLRSLLQAPLLPLRQSMHRQNSRRFRDPRTVQLFDRYATYNGSDPYKAPALLNMIPHLELAGGAYLPDKGMHEITLHLLRLANKMKVKIHLSHPVSRIVTSGEKVKGLISNGEMHAADLVLCDADMHFVYKHLLPEEYSPRKLLLQQKSSSACVFFWGIKKSFPQLHLHNILFSRDYAAEFRSLFGQEEPHEDPSIYINITSKLCSDDAPPGCENWFVMVNVPHNSSQAEIKYRQKLRHNVIKKINRMLGTSIEQYIMAEEMLDPFSIEKQTSSFGGSLYGNASNSRFSAFFRHANFSSRIRGLYFAGGSVHPGGGIPLCLQSAKIVAEIMQHDHLD